MSNAVSCEAYDSATIKDEPSAVTAAPLPATRQPPTKDAALAPGDDQQASVRKPIDRKWHRRRRYGNLAAAVEVGGDDLLRSRVAEPEPAVAPAGDSPSAMLLINGVGSDMR